MSAVRVERIGRSWQWSTAVAVGMAAMVAITPATRQASANVTASGGKLERMIVRAVPGHVAEAEQMVQAAGGTVGIQLSIIDGFAAQIPANAANAMRGANGVISAIDPDTRMHALSVDPTLGYDATGDEGSLSSVSRMVGAQALWAAGDTGAGVDVALVDTGVAPVAGLADKIVNGPDLSLDYQAGLPASVDAFGHGTHMAGIIAGRDPGATADATGCTTCLNSSGYSDTTKFVGVAPDARLVNVKVGAADGSTDVSQVIAGIDWVVTHKSDPGFNIKVLNLSFGTMSGQAYTIDPLAFAAEVAWRRGVVVVAAAGNDGSSATQLADPAYDPRILAVGAFDPNNSTKQKDWTPADFTNAGSSSRTVDVFAPGVHVLGLRDPGSYVDTNYPDSEVGTRFTRGSGTSQAAAVTSGLVADLFQRYPTATPDQMKNLLIRSSVQFSSTGLLSVVTNLLSDKGTLSGTKAMSRADKSLTSDGNGKQEFAFAKGTGSLEAARGGMHLNDGVSDLTGEMDIFGNAWNPANTVAAEAAGTAWQGGLWNGQRWSGDSWAGSSWTNSTWTAGDWAGQRWSGQRWSGLVWDGQRWSGQRWSDAGWSGQRWSGQRWSGEIWSSASWL